MVDIDNTRILYSTSQDPSSQDDFEEALTNVTDGWRGQQCIDAPNFASLGLSVGQNITLQFTNKAGPCADLTLVSSDDFNDLNYETNCINHVLTTKQRRDDVSNPELVVLREEAEAEALAEMAESSDFSDSNGLTLAEAGVIGAMVTFGVVALCFGFAWWAGVAAFGKKATSDFPQKHPSISSGSLSKV